MKPTDLSQQQVLETMVERAGELDHLIYEVMKELENKIVQQKLGDDYDDLEGAVQALEDDYHQQRAGGRLFVLGTVSQMLQDQMLDAEEE